MEIIPISYNVILRPYKISDVSSITVAANNRKIAANLTDSFPYPYKEKDAEVYIFSLLGNNPTTIFTIEIDGNASGSIGIFLGKDIRRLNGELGYWIAEKYWGKGIISMIIPIFVNYVFNNFKLIRIFARPLPFNYASIRVLEKSNFKLEATLKNALVKNGEILDEPIYSLLNINF